MLDSGAIDLGFNGNIFTWSNRKDGLANIKEGLDCAVCNQEWQYMYLEAGVKHLVSSSPDHTPILLDTHLEIEARSKPFRFEAMWTSDDISADVIEKAWQLRIEGSPCFKLARKIKNSNHFGHTKTRIKELESRLAEVQRLEPTKENLAIEAAICLELEERMEREKLKCKQKSRELWLQEGDRNSNFFF